MMTSLHPYAPTDGSSTCIDDAVGLPPAEAHRIAVDIIRNAESVNSGQHDAVCTALTELLAEGHLLIEDVPGVGKTMLAISLARSAFGNPTAGKADTGVRS